MMEETRCPHCGKLIPSGTPGGLCPECMVKVGISSDLASGRPEPKPPRTTPPAIEEIAPYFPQLEIIRILGSGGMGVVYQARQRSVERLVALKVLPPGAGKDPGFAERFMREARALAKLSHPNIVALYDFGHVSDLHYFIMEYVDGLNLRQLEQAGRLSPRETLRIIPQICDALQFAHDEGIVHRDIKPENVLLDKRGRVKIADFGLARLLGREAQDFRLTGAGEVVGTPHYMAPEQVEAPQTVDHRADIYSLGVVLYELLTGELPLGKFAAPSQKVQIHVRLDEVVLRALEKEPARRYQHVSEVKSEVESIAGQPALGSAAARGNSLGNAPVPGPGEDRASQPGLPKRKRTAGRLTRLSAAFSLPTLDPKHWLRRVILAERDILLPIKVAVIIMLLHPYLGPDAGGSWLDEISQSLNVSAHLPRLFLRGYIAYSVLAGAMLLAIRRLPMRLVQGGIFATSLVDACFLAALTLVTDGASSSLYWLFIVLVVRNAVVEPRMPLQLLLNLCVSASYYLVAAPLSGLLGGMMDANTRELLESQQTDASGYAVLMRFLLLVLITCCCYGVQVQLRRSRA